MTEPRDNRLKPPRAQAGQASLDVTELRKVAQAVFIATDENVALHIANRLRWAADEIERLRAALAAAPKITEDEFTVAMARVEARREGIEAALEAARQACAARSVMEAIRALRSPGAPADALAKFGRNLAANQRDLTSEERQLVETALRGSSEPAGLSASAPTGAQPSEGDNEK